jgi:hypothetical protein
LRFGHMGEYCELCQPFGHIGRLRYGIKDESFGPGGSAGRWIRAATVIRTVGAETDRARRLRRPRPGDRNSPGGTLTPGLHRRARIYAPC